MNVCSYTKVQFGDINGINERFKTLFDAVCNLKATSATTQTFTQFSVPYANSSGLLTEDNTGLSYDGTNLSVGHNNAGAYSGININGGRAGIFAALGGMLLNVGSGLAGGGIYDSTKQFTFQNRGNTQFKIYASGLAQGPWTQHTDCYGDFTVIDHDIEISNLANGYILKSPDGSRWKIVVNNSGVLSTVAL